MSNAGKPHIALLVGSTRNGASAKLAARVAAAIDAAGATCETLSLQNLRIEPCRNCDGCLKDAVCVIDDDGAYLDERLAAADGLMVFAPVFFSGPSAQLKAVYDRFQIRFVRRYVLGEPMLPKRPAQLIVVGAGGDPFGYEPLVTCTTSALNVANFRTEKVEPFIGINPKELSDEDCARIDGIARKFAEEVAFHRRDV